MTRVLGVDYGGRRIGTAIGDDALRIAMPLSVVAGRNDPTRDARAVADVGAAEAVEAYVVGLPLNMDDSDGPQAALTRKFAAELERLSGKPVQLHDERLSSDAAADALNEAGVRGPRRRELIDRIAAQKILQSYFDRIASGG